MTRSGSNAAPRGRPHFPGLAARSPAGPGGGDAPVPPGPYGTGGGPGGPVAHGASPTGSAPAPEGPGGPGGPGPHEHGPGRGHGFGRGHGHDPGRGNGPGNGRGGGRTLPARVNDINPSALAAEFFGTMILVFFAVGTAVFAKPFVGVLGIAIAFGFVLLALVYTIGPISGCHVNPAVTLGMVLNGRIDPITAVLYWVCQFAGGIVGAGLIAWVARSVPFYKRFGLGSFGSDGYGHNSAIRITLGGAFLTEVLLTTLLVLVVLAATHHTARPGFAGLAIGLALTVCHLIGIPITNTSVNPARALGPAIFADNNALNQVWVFIVAPLIGALVAVLVFLATHGLPGAGARQVAPGRQHGGAEGALRPQADEPAPDVEHEPDEPPHRPEDD